MPIYEYNCTNEECESAIEKQERIIKMKDKDEVQCKHCEHPLKRLISKTGGPHITWSLWRV